jgi:alpha-tubulin suppressor-like RCC1 family protein
MRLGDDEPASALGAIWLELPEDDLHVITAAPDYTCQISWPELRCVGRVPGAPGAQSYGELCDGGVVAKLPQETWLVAGGRGFACVGPRLACWGVNDQGQLGRGHTQPMDLEPALAAPWEPAGSMQVVDYGVTVGGRHACANTQVAVRGVCWGANESGQLGIGSTEPVGDDELPEAAWVLSSGGGGGEVEIWVSAAGDSHTCGLRYDRATDVAVNLCWGANADGQLGRGHTDMIGDDEPVDLEGGIDVPVGRLAAGAFHTCVLNAEGVYCWGRNDFGQLGYGHTDTIGDDELPGTVGPVPLGGNAIEIAAGAFHTCALLDTGAVRCWGRNDAGQLGYGHMRTIGDDETPASAGDVLPPVP